MGTETDTGAKNARQRMITKVFAEQLNDRHRKSRYKLRMEVLNAYGAQCQCCGEDQEEFLCIDHVDGGGRNHRKEIGTGDSVYRWLRQEGYPPGYQVLCHNCNFALGLRGYCPHQTKEGENNGRN
jgi:hypothetical protein